MSETDKEYFIELAMSYEDIITVADIELFATIYNEIDKRIIDKKKHRCAWWTLHKDVQYTHDKFNLLIEKHERLICERIKKRIAKIKK